jgi:hypothetical protein
VFAVPVIDHIEIHAVAEPQRNAPVETLPRPVGILGSVQQGLQLGIGPVLRVGDR